MQTTAPTAGRRTLHFDRIDEAMADVHQLAAADAAAGLAASGQWTFGQALNHLAAWVDFSYDGVPMTPPPLPIRLLVRLAKRRILYKPMRPGMRLPKVPGGTLAAEVVPTPAGLDRFRHSFARLAAGASTRPHLLFGPMTHAEWTALHLRHCELHLSFFKVG